MYGARPAASNWQQCYTTALVEGGLQRTEACACVLRHRDRDIDFTVHGDDFIATGDHDDLKWLQKLFEERFEISTNVIGHDVDDEKQLKVLNRNITVE